MMKFLLSVLLLSTVSFSFTQTFGNEWIDYGQSYYKFKIWENGIYKIDYNTLVNSGVPTTSFSTKNIQVFGREKEVPVFIVDGGDGSFDSGDYLLFYARKNDGWLDSTLYTQAEGIGNPGYSLYNDTINYFFTWNDQPNNLRFAFESFNNYADYTASPYWLYKLEKSYTDFYIEAQNGTSSSSSMFEPGEGWATNPINGVNGYQMYIDIPTYAPSSHPSAPPVRFHAKVVSNSNAPSPSPLGINHHFSWRLGQSNTILQQEDYAGYQQKILNTTFQTSLLNNGNTQMIWSILADPTIATDFQSVSYWSLIYAKETTLSGLNKDRFWIRNGAGRIYLNITNTSLTSPIMLVLGPTPKLVTMTNGGGGSWKALVSNAPTGIDQEVILQDESTVITIPAVLPVNGSGNFKKYDAFPADSALLMVYHSSLTAGTGQYAAYRSSPAGGSHTVVTAEVEDLYLQYGGGIEKHISGIRRFAHHMYENATRKPVALFLIGKGIREANESFNGISAGTRKSIYSYNASMIPSFGYPSSDVFITAGLGPSMWDPLIPTGRIAVKNNQELLDYLAKVEVHESNQDPNSIYNATEKDWQKQVLHFAGGATGQDQADFQYFLSGMEYTIENANFGGNVTTYKKTSSDPLDPTLVAEVSQQIEKGVSIMNFFGHASADGFEINVDDPSNWNNEGKYPLVIGNACYTGDIFQTYPSTSEKFVLLPKEGAIAFLSSVRTGYASYLDMYTGELYRQISSKNYGLYLSHQIQKTIQVLQAGSTGNYSVETTCAQMTLHGDPLLKVNWHERSEIDINEQSLYFQPSDINLTVDSIELNLILTNLGRSVTDTFTLEITRNFPGTSIDSNYLFFIPRLNYKDTFSFKMPLQPNIGLGINRFTVHVDQPSQILEFEETENNQILNKTLFINVDGIVPVVPYDFAVVPGDSVTVKASTINPIADFRTYRFELDTTDLFNSPQKRYAMVSGLGGVKEVHPSQWRGAGNNMPMPLVCTDSTVYFWRVAVDSSVLFWRESSFQYIPGKTGWGQDHFFQFKKNGFSNVVYNRMSRRREFDTITRNLLVDVYDHPNSNFMLYSTLFKVDNQIVEYAMCTTEPSLHVAIFDPVTLDAWGKRFNGQNPNHYFGNANDGSSCRNRVEYYFIFRQHDPAQMQALQNMINDSVPDGHYVLIYTTMQADYGVWPPGMFNFFANLGSQQIVPGLPDKSFIFFTRKGDPNFVHEVLATQPDDQHEKINLTLNLNGFDSRGQETSTTIGPAVRWETLYWKQDASEANSNDTTILRIQALDISGVIQRTIDTAFTSKDSIIQLNNLIPAAQYPYIRLGAIYKDSVTLTPAQVDRWHILYQPVPEAAIDGSNMYTWIPAQDTLAEGQQIKFAVDVKNISPYPMDSLLITYWVEDVNRVKHPIPYARQDSLRVPDIIRDTITFSTVGLSGINSLWMEVNPYINGSTVITDQPEQFHFNNLLQVPFYVNADDVNPILDVTFDGRHILNGDIISPESELVISLKDDNPWLVMDDIKDTTLFGIYLTGPDGVQKRIPFIDATGNTVMQWIPAEAQHKKFKIIYPAYFERDGKYTLLVQGADRSGNLSGDIEYRISFEVIHESSITYLMNYPNPFSTSTRFVFTLTGSKVPDEMIIQIMTVTGKVVREITEDEFGPMHIGRNVSEFSWNGTDEFGDPLANGVYLYRVLSQINGESIKHRDSGADTYFRKEFGKMYLMR